MPMNNTLNVSELLKRLGVVGDSRGSAEVLEQLRLAVQVADMSQLVPPLRGPIVAGSHDVIPGGGSVGNWSVHCLSAGGLQMLNLYPEGQPSNNAEYNFWISVVYPFPNPVVRPVEQLSFGQAGQSEFLTGDTAAAVKPVSAVRGGREDLWRIAQHAWVGPGLFFNIEHEFVNNPENLAVAWMEFPGAINP